MSGLFTNITDCNLGLGLLDELPHLVELLLVVTQRRLTAFWVGDWRILGGVVPVVVLHGALTEVVVALEAPSTELAEDDDATIFSPVPLVAAEIWGSVSVVALLVRQYYWF